MKLNKNLITFLGIGLIILLVLGFLTFYCIGPFGAKVVYQFTSGDKDKLSILKGAQPSEGIKNNATNTLTIPEQTIRKNIATLNLTLLSQKIGGVWVNLKFKGDPQELKIGVKGSLKDPYLYKPLYNRILEDLNGIKIDNGFLFWQKVKKYKDLSEFSKDSSSPSGKLTAIYFIDPMDIAVINPSSQKSEQLFSVSTPLRGTNTMYIKVDRTPFILNISKQDLNMYKGPDPLSVEIYKESDKIYQKTIPDDGIIEASNISMQPQKINIRIDTLELGIYKVLLTDQSRKSDVLISKIETNQLNFIFFSPVTFLGSSSANFWTNSTNITLRTGRTLQTIKIDDKSNLNMDTLGKTFVYDLQNQKQLDIYPKAAVGLQVKTAIHKLTIPKSDLTIKGDGYFAISKDSFFNPDPFNSIDLTSVTDTSSVDYIVANYQKVKKDGDWNIAQVYFDPKDINIDGDKLYFSLDLPGLSQAGGEITISSLEMTVNKPGWFNSANNNSINTSTPVATVTKTSEGFLSRIVNFFKNLWPFKSTTHSANSGQGKTELTNTPTPTPIPTLKDKLKISVQNGGGAAGIAAKYADLFKTEGFNNVESGNSPSDIKNASISYNKAQEGELESTLSQIETILNNDYKTVNRITTADKDKINIILGELPKPTPAASPTATIKR